MNWWETPEIEAAKKKALAGGASGVFTLDQLHALGQTGDMKTDWLAGGKPDPNSFIGGGGRATIDQTLNLPAGYYRIPGVDGAEYYDPHSGRVSQQFADWANSGKIERNDLTGVPTALMDPRDGGEVFRSRADQQPEYIKTLNDIFALGKGADGTYQDAQDRVLGLGRYQQFLTDKNGKQMRVSDAVGSPAVDPATAPYTDRSKPTAGAFDRLSTLTGKTPAEMDAMMGVGGASKTTGYYADYWQQMRDTLASNYETNALGYKGLQDERAARGLDINTGTSDAEKKRIYDTVSRITDPAQRAAYISAQDPGNLTDALRAERYALRAGERDQISTYEAAHPTIEYNATGKYGQPAGAQVKVTSGSVTFTDTATGRENFIGNVPKTAELVKPKYDRVGDAAHRIGGGVMGFMVGLATGNLPGAFMGAYIGAGGPTTKGSLNRPGDFMKAKTNQAHLMNLQEVGTALAFARFWHFGVFGGPSAAGGAANMNLASKGFVVGR